MTAVLLAILIAAPAIAQVSTPPSIKMQGHLSDKTGGTPVPAEGTYTMTFDLYDDEFAGSLDRTVPVRCPWSYRLACTTSISRSRRSTSVEPSGTSKSMSTAKLSRQGESLQCTLCFHRGEAGRDGLDGFFRGGARACGG